jgi:hypothetical protein
MDVMNWLQRSAEFCFLVFLSISLVFPTVFGWPKLLLFAYFVAAVLIVDLASRRSTIVVHGSVLRFMCLMLIVNGIFVLRGILNGASGDASIEVASVYLLFPVFYLVLILISPSIIDLSKLAKVLVLVSILISLLTVAQGLRVFGFDTMPGYSLLYFVYPGLENNYVHHAFTGTSGFLPRATERLIFLGPFSVGLFVAGKALGIPRLIVILNMFVVFAAAAFTGRRAILLVILLAIATLVARRFLIEPRRSSLRIGLLVSLVVLAVAGASLTRVDSMSASDGSLIIQDYVVTNFGNARFDIRTTQVEQILAQADKSPVLGTGFGNGIPGYIRDPEHPWRVELTYMALLFQTGMIGVLLYMLVAQKFASVILAATKKSGIVVWPFVMGMCGALLAAGTNPYLNYGTGQWVLFLPIAIFNAVLVGPPSGFSYKRQERLRHV